MQPSIKEQTTNLRLEQWFPTGEEFLPREEYLPMNPNRGGMNVA